ncbi:hypothetical protein E3P92_01017 [Wallemia ichthyophaga]|uniref:Uncharacterized protein n=1 Tax=Wallemia ichthyophaga TaxID=245174 RepID=A0A4T0HHT9_WALIC|nr:hypothetical protein E3P91_01889 [Wallemia ichthyophaga]TIA81319.1 hypothetical protein E3P98_02126 [Wallemia ichthyophaga]TIA92986.1 hypothetical protein E3P97_01148 [Wallemia ichthyophaga]TIB02361.1 hypothetical protein E3P95_00969 [Wallemia ichthyophaga]TIB03182.1 hypothetical protein E3P94_01101 [Wallemia ichthyophaga]
MPHKRAKRSVREKNTKDTGFNNAPSGYRIDREELPKGAMRILMGGQIQADYRDKKNKRKRDADDANEKEKADVGGNRKKTENSQLTAHKQLKIRPEERLKDYNRRIDNKMRKDINSTIKSHSSEKTAKQMNKKMQDEDAKRKEKAEKKAKTKSDKLEKKREEETVTAAGSQSDSDGETIQPPRDFAGAERVRLNDVAQAPPSLPRMNRQAKRFGVEDSNAGSRVGAPLMRQLELEKERARVISLYRAQKGKRLENWVSSKEEAEAQVE